MISAETETGWSKGRLGGQNFFVLSSESGCPERVDFQISADRSGLSVRSALSIPERGLRRSTVFTG
jgi:hypothetical protein